MKPLFSHLAVFVLLVSACGDGEPDSAKSEGSTAKGEDASPGNDVSSSLAWESDPCSLIDDQEMSDLLPNPVAGAPLSRGLCDYGPTDLNLGRVDVEVFIQNVSATGCDLFFSVGGFSSAEPVEGVGTSARWKGASGPKQLGVCVDDETTLAVTVYDPDKTTDPLAAARAISELVIARLSGQ